MSKLLAMMMKEKVEYMPLTVVGSPTITDGVVSGFSRSDYVEGPNFPANFNEIILVTNIKENTYGANAIFALQSGNRTQRKFYSELQNQKIIFGYRSSANNSNTSIDISYTYTNNTFFYVRLKLYPTQIILGHSIDGVTWEEKTVDDIIGLISSLPLRYGIVTNIPIYLNGSIDFNKTYIIIDGTKYKFTIGA